ncbi:MAG: ion channel protein [Bacteroidetes bacterium MedPE-SWsnd-G2]|nr:MAG: ion channel protein [Bacteroidetes bacterium MedPE-SWsnd-G2]
MRAVLFSLFVLISCLGFSQNTALFEKGNALYNEGKYAEAIDVYEAILERGKHSEELYFNLGNANYKMNRIAPSIYYFEKALQLNPNDKEIQNNLNFAQNMTIDDIEILPDVGFRKVVKDAVNTLNYDQWAYATVGVTVLFVILFLVYFLSYASTTKRMSFIGSGVAMGVALICLTFAFLKFNIESKNNPAIVFAVESQVKTEPNLRSSEAFKLHEGTKVQLIDTVKNWKKIKLSDGKTGWVPNEDVKAL